MMILFGSSNVIKEKIRIGQKLNVAVNFILRDLLPPNPPPPKKKKKSFLKDLSGEGANQAE